MKRSLLCPLRTLVFSSLFLAQLLVAPNGTAAGPDPFGPGPWEQLGTSKGVKLGRKLMPNSELFAVRGETTIPASPEKVASVICDPSRWKEWTRSMMGAGVIEDLSAQSRVVFQTFDLPFPVRDRDVVYQYEWRRNGQTIEVEGRNATPVNAPKSIGVRMNLVIGRWFLNPAPNNQTHLVLEILMDPRGSLPSWFVNLVQRNYPTDTLNALKAQVQKPDIQALSLP